MNPNDKDPILCSECDSSLIYISRDYFNNDMVCNDERCIEFNQPIVNIQADI